MEPRPRARYGKLFPSFSQEGRQTLFALQVELEVPQTCRFTLRATGCSLSEVVDADADGNPVFAPAPAADAFAAEMEKYVALSMSKVILSMLQQ